jgi:hypothetical protein
MLAAAGPGRHGFLAARRFYKVWKGQTWVFPRIGNGNHKFFQALEKKSAFRFPMFEKRRKADVG